MTKTFTTTRSYAFDVDHVSHEQIRYREEVNTYIIRSDQPQSVVLAFATSVVQMSRYPKEAWERAKDPGVYFCGYHEFTKIDTNTYEYKVTKLFTD